MYLRILSCLPGELGETSGPAGGPAADGRLVRHPLGQRQQAEPAQVQRVRHLDQRLVPPAGALLEDHEPHEAAHRDGRPAMAASGLRPDLLDRRQQPPVDQQPVQASSPTPALRGRMLSPLVWPFMRIPEQGAETSVSLVSPRLKGPWQARRRARRRPGSRTQEHAPSADQSLGRGRVGEAVAAATGVSISDARQPTERWIGPLSFSRARPLERRVAGRWHASSPIVLHVAAPTPSRLLASWPGGPGVLVPSPGILSPGPSPVEAGRPNLPGPCDPGPGSPSQHMTTIDICHRMRYPPEHAHPQEDAP